MSSKKAKKTDAGARASGKNPAVEMVRQLARILDTHGLSELVLEAEEVNVTLRRGPGQPSTVIHTAPQGLVAAAPAMAASAEVSAAPAAASAQSAEDDSLHLVTSPFVGTFYRSPNPDSGPYTNLGDRVDRGAVLCIVEAMKLMNEIEADMAGEIAAILVENGEPVEYGQPLFKIAPA